MMEINWNRFVVGLLPLKMRTGTVFGLIRAMIAGVAKVFTDLTHYNNGINGVRYMLNHTSQVWSIQSVLNDNLDPELRRIYITDAGGEEVIVLQPDADLKPVVLQPDDDPAAVVALQPDSGYEGGSFDFVVNMPFEVLGPERARARALVQKYKLAGKRFDII